MELERSDVEKIAQLAHLQIAEEDINGYAQTLTNILDLIGQMNAINTDNIEPMAHPMDATQRLRQDQVTESGQREHFQAIAPSTENGLYLVPKVIE